MVSQDSTSAADLRVVVAEAHHLVRYALVDVLASAGAVVTQATDSESALREVADHGADVLMVNLDLPGIERGHVVEIGRAHV